MKTFFIIFTIIFSVLFSPKALAEEVIPSIISFSESAGSTEGGNTITLSGSNFTGSTVVRIGGVQASTTYVDSSTIQVVVPAGSEGEATISASNGMVAALANSGYMYVAPIPEPTPTPTPTPTPAPISSPNPAPPANQSSNPVRVLQTASPPVVEEVGVDQSNAAELTANTEVKPVVEESVELIPLSQNSYIVYSDDQKENLVIETPFNVSQKFVLRERINKKWVYVDKSYSFNNKVVFLDTELNSGSTYKVIVEIKNKKNIAAWFTFSPEESVVR